MRLAVSWCAMTMGMLSMSSAVAQEPSVERGRALYENHCVVCHTVNVHARVNRLAVSRAEVREIVEKWQSQERLSWSAQEVDDVVKFLNRTRYQFP